MNPTRSTRSFLAAPLPRYATRPYTVQMPLQALRGLRNAWAAWRGHATPANSLPPTWIDSGLPLYSPPAAAPWPESQERAFALEKTFATLLAHFGAADLEDRAAAVFDTAPDPGLALLLLANGARGVCAYYTGIHALDSAYTAAVCARLIERLPAPERALALRGLDQTPGGSAITFRPTVMTFAPGIPETGPPQDATPARAVITSGLLERAQMPARTLQALRRWSAPGALHLHELGLASDHRDEAHPWHFLLPPDALWRAMTIGQPRVNRLRASHWATAFAAAGFTDVQTFATGRFEAAALALKPRLAAPFRHLEAADLLTRQAVLIARAPT